METEKNNVRAYAVHPEEFTEELLPLIGDFFTATAKRVNGTTIEVTFTNGEVFTLTVEKK